MDLQTILNLVGTAALTALGWAARSMFEAIRELQRDLADHKVHAAREYATNADITRIDDKLDRILERLTK